ncbi:MAG TPA: cytochrome b/b6 domain-containing protein [Acidimicrobiales bacterium]|nr:cytochrome b/b6 domain-containing protein [Acidimicrobiales bacterium]
MTTSPSTDRPPPASGTAVRPPAGESWRRNGEGSRFDGVEKALHWANAALFFALMATAVALFVDPVSVWIGRRALVRDLHVAAGVLLPVPWLLAFTVGRTPMLLADVRRLDRWTDVDWRWLRSLGRDPYLEVGKFNPGQKLNAALVAGSVPVMLGTGAIMRWFEPFPLDWRRGATFVHDWLAVLLFALVVGHAVLATRALLRR